MNTDKIAFAYAGSLMSNQMVFAQSRIPLQSRKLAQFSMFARGVAQENLLRITGMLPPNCQRFTKRYILSFSLSCNCHEPLYNSTTTVLFRVHSIDENEIDLSNIRFFTSPRPQVHYFRCLIRSRVKSKSFNISAEWPRNFRDILHDRRS